MKNVQKIDLGLTGYDELFMNDAERKENKLPRIYDVPISEIDDFPDHPFKVKVDEEGSGPYPHQVHLARWHFQDREQVFQDLQVLGH